MRRTSIVSAACCTSSRPSEPLSSSRSSSDRARARASPGRPPYPRPRPTPTSPQPQRHPHVRPLRALLASEPFPHGSTPQASRARFDEEGFVSQFKWLNDELPRVVSDLTAAKEAISAVCVAPSRRLHGASLQRKLL